MKKNDSDDGCCYKNINVAKLFRDEVKPALGCTEVGAIGLASAASFMAINGCIPSFLKEKNTGTRRDFNIKEIRKITVKLDRNVYKNAKSVSIPIKDTFRKMAPKGIKDAMVLGILCEIDKLRSGRELEIFNLITDTNIKNFERLSKVPVDIKIVDKWTGKSDIFINIRIEIVRKNTKYFGDVIIKHRHSNIAKISNDKGILFQNETKYLHNSNNKKEELLSLSISDLIKISENLPKSAKDIIKESIKLNTVLAEEGLANKYGLNIGKSLFDLVKANKLENSFINQAKIQTSAACDARMGGSMKPAMSVGGAGNQGIMASIPIIILAGKYGYNEDKLIKALSLSYLVTISSTYCSGELSASCGCGIKAGIGATAGITYYLGGSDIEVSSAINNMAATIPGMICDGAKSGCAMKLSSSTAIAIESSLLALNGTMIEDEGIIERKAEKTMQNIGKISNSQVFTDRVLVEKILLPRNIK